MRKSDQMEKSAMLTTSRTLAWASFTLSLTVSATTFAQGTDRSPTWQHVLAAPYQYAVSLDAHGSHGMLVATSHTLMARGSDGEDRWQKLACASTACPPAGSAGYTTWLRAVVRDDGGVWAIRSTRNVDASSARSTLAAVHLDPVGNVVREVVLTDASLAGVHAMEASQNDLTVVVDASPPGSSSFLYTRLDAEGNVIGSGRHVIWEDSGGRVSMRTLGDGATVISVVEELLCSLGCASPRTAVLRIEQHGVLGWRYDFQGQADAVTALESDGSATGVVAHEIGAPALVSISADGAHEASRPLSDLGNLRVDGVSPLIGGRRLVFYSASGATPKHVALMDRHGRLTSRRAVDVIAWFNPTASPFGFLAVHDRNDASAELLSATTLRTQQRLRLHGASVPDFIAHPFWHVLDDGVVYAAAEVSDGEGVRRLALARFDLAGDAGAACSPQRQAKAAVPSDASLLVSACVPPRAVRPTDAPSPRERPR
ncbi:hypothetical protein ACQQ2N_17415 [Dokdonella sp. MW10]|uniref:hypothetical protein n=1 Tax=Dokdonella sp. MW10 TaxID=2992926 RepID=UPI003F7D90B4